MIFAMTKKILVVDDEPDILDMIEGHFALRGFAVTKALDGKDAIAAVKAEIPDAIILDMKMKEMDGDQALPEIKRIAPNAKVFVVTAFQDEEIKKRVKEMGVEAYFEKPVSIVALHHAITESLN